MNPAHSQLWSAFLYLGPQRGTNRKYDCVEKFNCNILARFTMLLEIHRVSVVHLLSF